MPNSTNYDFRTRGITAVGFTLPVAPFVGGRLGGAIKGGIWRTGTSFTPTSTTWWNHSNARPGLSLSAPHQPSFGHYLLQNHSIQPKPRMQHRERLRNCAKKFYPLLQNHSIHPQSPACWLFWNRIGASLLCIVNIFLRLAWLQHAGIRLLLSWSPPREDGASMTAHTVNQHIIPWVHLF